ncbi:Uncharacterised protein [Bordetella pertussis]|nr:Uncharacterised protein [Bordetella pertussis]
MAHGGDGMAAVRRIGQQAVHIGADRDAVIGGQRGAQAIAQAAQRMIVVLGEDDARTAAQPQRGQHDLLVVGRAVAMDDVVAALGDQPAQRRPVMEPGRQPRGVLHVHHLDAGNLARIAVQPAGAGHRHGQGVPGRQRARQVDDIGDMAAAVAAMEIGVQDLHLRGSDRNISLA